MIHKAALLAVALSAAAGWAYAGGQSDPERAVIQLQRDIWAAEIRRDAEFLGRAWATDYTQTSSLGEVEDRAQRLKGVRAGSTAFRAVEVLEIRARLFGETAVVTARLAIKGQIESQPAQGAVRSLTVFVRRDGRWQAVAAQYTRVADK